MKKLSISLIILILLVLLYLLVQHRATEMVAPEAIENFLGVDTLDVDKIVISKLGGKLTLSRAGDNWYLVDGDEPRRVDRNAMNQLLDIVGGMKVGNVISDNPANQMKFQVDTLTGSTVSVYSGDELLSAVVIGKMADFMHTYVRLRGENEVYIAEGMMSHLFKRSPSDWRDKTIFDIDPAQVRSVEVDRDGEKCVVVREDTLWRVSKAPFTDTLDADQDEAEDLVASLCGLNAGGFATPYDTTYYDFSSVALDTKILLADGTMKTLEAASGDEEATRHFVRIPDDTSVFVLFDAVWKKIAKSFHDLLPDEKNS